jgi:hypothetical protein
VNRRPRPLSRHGRRSAPAQAQLKNQNTNPTQPRVPLAFPLPLLVACGRVNAGGPHHPQPPHLHKRSETRILWTPPCNRRAQRGEAQAAIPLRRHGGWMRRAQELCLLLDASAPCTNDLRLLTEDIFSPTHPRLPLPHLVLPPSPGRPQRMTATRCDRIQSPSGAEIRGAGLPIFGRREQLVLRSTAILFAEPSVILGCTSTISSPSSLPSPPRALPSQRVLCHLRAARWRGRRAGRLARGRSHQPMRGTGA